MGAGFIQSVDDVAHRPNKKASRKRGEIPLEPSYWDLPDTPSHTTLQKVSGWVVRLN